MAEGSSETVDCLAPPMAGDAPRRASWRRRSAIGEIGLVACLYGLYDASRTLMSAPAAGYRHADMILRAERLVGGVPERWLNHAVSAHAWVAIPCDFAYATLHFLVTPAVLVWLWRKNRCAYPRARTALAAATIVALIGFTTFPTAPPRLLHGFIDTMSLYHRYGWWSGAASAPRGLASLTNQFAAMPSMHVGWAVWCGWQLLRHGNGVTSRVGGFAYPLVMTLVVLATANHFLMDAIAGTVVMIAACGLAEHLARSRETIPCPSGSSSVSSLSGAPRVNDRTRSATADRA